MPIFEGQAEEGGWRVAPARTCKHAPSSTFLRARRRKKGEHRQQRGGKSVCSRGRGGGSEDGGLRAMCSVSTSKLA